jgi:hypothetical protein
MTNLNGKLYCVTSDGKLWMRLPELTEIDWTLIGAVPEPATALAAYAGKLFVTTTTNALYWRDAIVGP